MLPYAPWLCWLTLIIGAILTPIFAMIDSKLRNCAPVAFVAASVIFSLSMIPDAFTGNAVDWVSGKVLGSIPFDWQIPWVSSLGVSLGVLVDPFNVLMAIVVSGIGLLVTLFSVGYMRGEPSLTRFWFFIQLFIAGYVMLVLSDNLLLMFIGWEIVGVSITFIVAFWHKDPHRAHVGLKANMVPRVGDVCLLTSILVIYAYSGTFNLMDLQQSADWMLQLSRSGFLLITALMLFGGAIGKSAQFPLQVWLPDALAASPSSFNALTECLAGAFLVARVLPIFHRALAMGCGEMVFFFSTVAWIGAFSAFLGALIAMARRNIHKVLAYSILSVIGYMLVALGLGGLMSDLSLGFLAGTFLLTVDAFISGLLFLTGAFISYATGSDDMYYMGGIESKVAHRGMEVGVLAIIGLPPLSGFWCTNWIQTVALDLAGEASGNGQHVLMISSYGLFTLLIITGGITAFYGLRVMGLVFGEGSHKSEGRRVKKVPALMRISLAAMVVVTAIIDFSVPLLIPRFNMFFLPLLNKLIFKNIFDVLKYIVPSISTPLSCLALAVGGYLAYELYMARKGDPAKLIEEHRFLRKAHDLLWNRCYVDTFYYKIFVDGTKALSQKVYRYFEVSVIDQANLAIASFFRRLSEVMYKYPELKGIDALNYSVARFFRRLSEITYEYPELRGIDAFNYLVADVTATFCQYFRKTHSGVLSHNMLAASIGFLLLIILIFIFGGYIP
ncbi:MAG: NADH-quinone oxidoreductase subunit L [Candidatus Bathyarchaeia archaeon]